MTDPLVIHDKVDDVIRDPSGYVRVYPGAATWADADDVEIDLEGADLLIPLSWVPTVIAALQAAVARCCPVPRTGRGRAGAADD
ncbi:hypothetical protein [Candidatus Thiodictyon syntrophicum]|jgi:hypothetical protein|uniref:Uncharacterized protein n=1 Tax=Candidatus Thiodictyon syntrophicum TaxID=1166950 RepID=A0A2K8UHU1_9GAMM|nr:hypothetical protein [Candidatus Thiodictyon syntrophicum]AUB85156.1 hypothetical protein THSYN_30005 [Candidatus Thiodictyon syntrophicum]